MSSRKNLRNCLAPISPDTVAITPKLTQRQPTLDFDTEWRRFAKLCGSTVNAAAAWTALGGSVSGSYRGELEFDIRPHGDVMALLGGSVQRVSDRLYLLNSKTNISIPRQVQRENHLGFHTNGLTTDTIHHHAIVLVNPRNIIVEEMSLVELKTDESNCCEFPVRRGKVGHVGSRSAS